MNHVQAVCRACGQKKPVEGFAMSYEAKKMVCAECAKSYKTTTRTDKPMSKPVSKPVDKPMDKPRISNTPLRKTDDYDADDIELEKLSKKKETVTKDGGYKCPQCGYIFSAKSGKIYNKCPFCRSAFTNRM